MYRRGEFRDDLLSERLRRLIGIDARLAEIDELLHGHRRVPRCDAAPRSSAARTSARTAAGRSERGASEETVIEPARDA